MPVEFFISYRYLLNKGRKKNLLSLVSFFAFIGVFLGVLGPILIMSVFSGFQKEIREKILGIQGHITIQAKRNKNFQNYPTLIKEISKIKNVASVIPYIETQGMLKLDQELKPIVIRGLHQNSFKQDPELSKILYIQRGKKDLSRKYYALIGNELAKNHFINLHTRLSIITMKDTISLAKKPTILKAYPTGIFKTGYYEYDNSVIYLSLKTLQSEFNLGSKVNSIDIKVKNIWKTKPVIKKLTQKYGYRYYFSTWQNSNANLFKALATERTLMWVIMAMVLVVAIFNVMSSQIMLVIEKKKEIGILKTLGMGPTHIKKIFLIEGLMITSVSASLGALMGTILAKYLKQVLFVIEILINFFKKGIFYFLNLFTSNSLETTSFYFFPKEVYYFEKIPIDISLSRAFLLVVLAMILSVLAGLLPSSKAAKLKPVEVMRYE